jgi:hypothetical protein
MMKAGRDNMSRFPRIAAKMIRKNRTIQDTVSRNLPGSSPSTFSESHVIALKSGTKSAAMKDTEGADTTMRQPMPNHMICLGPERGPR